MMTGEILIAALLLCGDGEPRHNDVMTWTMVTRPCILCLSLKNETLDDRETRFMLGQDVLGDLDTLRGRYREFFSYPTMGDSNRFPDKKFVAQCLGINRSVRTYLVLLKQLNVCRSNEVECRIVDLDNRYAVWDAVRDSAQDYYYATVRRGALSLLRDLIGVESYELGRLPPPY